MAVKMVLGTYDTDGSFIPDSIGSATKAVSVVPDDGNDLAVPTRRLWVGGAGAISMILSGDVTPVILSGVPAGTMLELRIKRIRATGTTATLMVALT